VNVLALFAGIGGVELGLEATGGFRTVCYVERDSYAVEVLKARMQEGALADAPIWDDVTTFDGCPWRGLVDVVTGGFPCQDISAAGKGAGIKEGTRSGLWSEMFRIVCEVRPRYVLIENVSMLLARGLGRVLADLSSCGYDADWDCIPARAVGAPHRRDRIFIVAHVLSERLMVRNVLPRDSARQHRTGDEGCEASAISRGHTQRHMPDPRVWWLVDPADVPDTERPGAGTRNVWRQRQPTEPYVGRVAHGVPVRVDRLRCLGNAVVPQVAYWVGCRILEHRGGARRGRQ